MGIAKIGSQNFRNTEFTRISSYNCRTDELTQVDAFLLQKFPCYDSDGCELAELGCELAMSGDQIFNAPYDLYDLPDLKEILSLETWNLCLTEEDRLSLAAYLPDMDDSTYYVTMIELLSGNSLFFGSPLRSFFHRLKGGLFSPQVTQTREGLLFLQRRQYYHSLKSYHEDMVQKFADMERIWSSSHLAAPVEERVRIWNNRYNKPSMLVDLNTSPSGENLSNGGDREAPTIPQLKRLKHMGGILTTHCSALSSDLILGKAKGVLKVKSMETDSLKNHIQQPLLNKTWAKRKQTPKGVLKLKPKGGSAGYEKERRLHTPRQITNDPLGLHDSRFCTPQYAPTWNAYNFFENSCYPSLKNIHEISHGSSHSSVHQREEALELVAPLFKRSLSMYKKINMAREVKVDNHSEVERGLFQSKANQSLTAYFSEAANIREPPNEKNLLKNFDQWNCILDGSSSDHHSSAMENHQEKGLMTLFHPKNAQEISRMLTIDTSKHRAVTNLSEHPEIKHTYHGDPRPKTPPGIMSFPQDERVSRKFPITYKRKKAHKKLNLMDPLGESTMMVDLESPIVPSSTPNMKPKAIKIKFKGWSGYVAGSKP